MSDVWVANASPVIALAKVGHLPLLNKLSKELLLPEAVALVDVPQELIAANPVEMAHMQPGVGHGTKMIDDMAPAAEATVWTILFSRMLEPEKKLSTAMEMTAAGMDEAKVRPTLRPR